MKILMHHGRCQVGALSAWLVFGAFGLAGCNPAVIEQQLQKAGAQTSPTATPSPSSTPSSTATPTPAGRGVTSSRVFGSTTAPYGYIEYLPPGYAGASNWPLMVMLHGLGEQGNGDSQLQSVRMHGPNKQIDQRGKDYPFVILTPQSPVWWNSDTIDQFVAFALNTYKINSKRVYVTGLSMGGAGTIKYVGKYPHRVAAAIPICPADSLTQAEANQVVAQNVAIWSTHAMDDGVVNMGSTKATHTRLAIAMGAPSSYDSFNGYPWNTTQTYTAYFRTSSLAYIWDFVGQNYENSAGVFNPPRIMTLYPSGGHGIWDQMYSDQKMYDWLLRFSKP